MNVDLPSIYKAADAGSNFAQKRFLLTVGAEYSLLLLLSVLSVARSPKNELEPWIFTVLSMLFLVLILKFFRKQDQNWYRARALAESAKTLSWRYSMRAHPFSSPDDQVARAELINNFKELLEANRIIGGVLSESPEHGEQVTAWMSETRNKPLKDRIEIYLNRRIRDQKQWYAKKAKSNTKARTRWMALILVIYLLCAASLFAPFGAVETWNDALDPLIVAATCIVGWLQVKKHSELSASYSLTAQEIGLLESKFPITTSEDKFSELVNETEFAFSREHTQWLARKDAIA